MSRDAKRTIWSTNQQLALFDKSYNGVQRLLTARTSIKGDYFDYF